MVGLLIKTLFLLVIGQAWLFASMALAQDRMISDAQLGELLPCDAALRYMKLTDTQRDRASARCDQFLRKDAERVAGSSPSSTIALHANCLRREHASVSEAFVFVADCHTKQIASKSKSPDQSKANSCENRGNGKSRNEAFQEVSSCLTNAKLEEKNRAANVSKPKSELHGCLEEQSNKQLSQQVLMHAQASCHEKFVTNSESSAKLPINDFTAKPKF